MRGGCGRAALWIGAAGAAFLIASFVPARAAGSITTPDGAVYSVWEVRARGPVDDPDARASAIAYSVSDGSGTRVGLVTGTTDAVADTSPSLALDRASGSVVAVWSRSDGVYLKIAYARFVQGGWTDLHFLTFGPGNDLLPRAATSSAGSYLFWITEGSRYLYAPVELSAGRLLAAPRELRLGSPRGLDRVTLDSGGNDGGGPPAKNGGRGKSAPIWMSPDVTIEGGNDGGGPPSKTGGKGGHAPIWLPWSDPLIEGGKDGGGPPLQHEPLWGVGSDAGCRSLILALPDPAGPILQLVGFTNGAIHELDRVQVPTVVPERFGDDTAAAYLASICR